MTDNNYKKKLIEVAIPLEAINKASVREKSIRHGHPSTLHLWWARRPLAACRAVLFAQLVNDPSSHPEKFPTEEAQEEERERLFRIIEDLVIWENSTNEEVLEKAHAEILRSCGNVLPSVYDPFSGGCSIPLEAQRLGLPAYGSDLNPVAVMIGKAMIEIPAVFKDKSPVNFGGPEKLNYRNADGLAEDVNYYGQLVRKKAHERIGHLYPQIDLPLEYGGGKATAIAWIWSRTIPSPDPAFSSVHVPIASSFALSTKKGNEAWIDPIVDKSTKTITYIVRNGGTKEEIEKAKRGTKEGRGANFRCLLSGAAITPDYVKAKGKQGELSETLIGIVAQGNKGRTYTGPIKNHEEIAKGAQPDWRPDTALPADIKACWTTGYGMKSFGDLFTDRQLVALNTFSKLIREVQEQVEKDALEAGMANDAIPLRDGGNGAKAYAEAVSVYLAFVLDKCSDYWSSICTWHSSKELIRNTFGRQVIPMSWDFAETNPFSNSSGNWSGMLNWVSKCFTTFTPHAKGRVVQSDAQTVTFPDATVVSSDPPYYDNIAYADLSDFFYCWLKPSLKSVYPDVFSILASPKSEELVATPHRHGTKQAAEKFFLVGMRKAIRSMVEQTSSSIPTTIYYAFKQSEIRDEGISSTGWATFLQAVIEAGYSVVGTWPMRTEMANRMIASGANALANSVVLVCRKREGDSEIITRAEFIRILKKELPPAIHELQKANITPVDMPQASIGPGIGVFSRYKTVLESDDSPMTVKTALQIINKELDTFLSEQEGEFDADTRFAVTWFEQNGTKEGDFGDADNLARARGLSVDSAKHAGIVASSAGKVRLLGRDELEDEWTPATDTHLTVWECTQYLIRALQEEGEYSAAVLLKQMGPDLADAARDLSYRLFVISDKQGQAKEASSYNSLIAVWSDLTAQAATISDADVDQEQLKMF